MNTVKKIWPTPFQIEKGNVLSLVVQLVILLLICTVIGWVFSLLSHLWIIGWVFGILGSLVGIYSVVGIVLCVLNFLGAIR